MSRITVPQNLPPTAAHIQRAPTGGRLALKSEKATKKYNTAALSFAPCEKKRAARF